MNFSSEVPLDSFTGSSKEPTDLEEPTSIFIVMSAVTKYLHGYIMLFVIIGGIIGNSLSTVVFTRCKNKDLITVTYFMPLAFVDSVGLLYGGMNWMSRGLEEITHGRYRFDEPIFAAVELCKIVRYIYRVATCMSSYIIVIFSIERFIGVWFPLKIKSWMNQSRRKKILLGALIVILCINTPILHFYKFYYWQETFKSCFFYEPAYNELQMYLLVELMDNVLPHTLPCVLIFLLSIGIVLGVWRARRATIATAGRSRIDMEGLVSLILVALLYLITTLPYITVWGYVNYYSTIGHGIFPGMTKMDIAALNLVGEFCTSVSMMNYSFNFLIYASSLKIYQKELKKMFFCKCCKRSICTRKKDPFHVTSK